MTKADMASVITRSPAWDGASASDMVKHLTKREIKDIYDQLHEAEEEYFEETYER